MEPESQAEGDSQKSARLRGVKLSSGEAKPVHRTGDRIFSVNILASSKGVLSTSVVFIYQALVYFLLSS